jgi:hypothetical protein
MPINVHILATCLSEDLIDGTLLVFQTLRVGFPTAQVTIWLNGLNPEPARKVTRAAEGCMVQMIMPTAHDRWISKLLARFPEPFWICDTDVIFHRSVEGFADETTTMTGRYEPPFVEPWSKTHKVARLHTSLLWLHPMRIREAVREWMTKWHPKGFPFLPEIELVRQTYVPQGPGKPPLFYDTCAGIYQAIGGTQFTSEQNAAFDHLHCATYVDRIGSVIPGLADAHNAVYQKPELVIGMRESQQEFYERNTYA